MIQAWLLLIAILGLVVASVSATAVQVLHEFARHKLEEYCRIRGKLNWFSRIIDSREAFALGAQTLQMISLSTSVTCGLIWFFSSQPFETASPLAVIGLIGLWSLILLAANCWVPWGVERIAAASFLYRTWRIWWFVSMLLKPLTAGVEVVSALFQRASGQEESEQDDEEAFEHEIRSMVSEGEHDGLLEPDARDMIEGVIELDDTAVGKVMTPRSKVDALDADSSWEEMLAFVVKVGRTRIPVFEKQLEKPTDVIGILFAKDLLGEFSKSTSERKNLRQLMRKPWMVPESTVLDEMLKRFLASRTHLAIVVDEYGSMSGVITIEDILEEIVGEIVDETDMDMPAQIHRISQNEIEVDGSVHVEDLNEQIGLELPCDDDYDTVAGLIMSTIGRIPKPDQRITIGNVHFDVQQASRRQIERVKLTVIETNGRTARAS